MGSSAASLDGIVAEPGRSAGIQHRAAGYS